MLCAPRTSILWRSALSSIAIGFHLTALVFVRFLSDEAALVCSRNYGMKPLDDHVFRYVS